MYYCICVLVLKINDIKVTKELSDSISTCGISESIAYNNGRVTLDKKKDYSYKSLNLCTFKHDLCTMNAHKVYRLNRLRYILLSFFLRCRSVNLLNPQFHDN